MHGEHQHRVERDDVALHRAVLLGYALLGLVVLIGGLYVAGTIRARDQAVAIDDRVWRPSQVAARDLLGFAIDQETGQRGFVVTGDERFLEPYRFGRAGAVAALSELRDLLDGEADMSLVLGEVEAALDQWQRNSAEPEIALAQDDLAAAQAQVAMGTGRTLFDDFRAVHERLVDAIDARSAAVIDRRNDAFRTVVVAMVLAGAGVIAGATVSLLVARRWISRLRETRSRLRVTVDELQSALLPRSIPALDRVEIAARYVPATADLDIGGDFYDVVRRSDTSVTITIGDVCGHDIEAAVLTGMVRQTIRAAAAHFDDPAEVLRWANQAMVDDGGTDRFVTVAQCHLDTATRRLHVALAGHPGPLLIPADGGPPTEIGRFGTALGIVDAPLLNTVEVQLRTGDQLLLYTDGLVENSIPRLDAVALGELVESARQDSADGTAGHVLDGFHRLELRPSRDDLAIVAVRMCP